MRKGRTAVDERVKEDNRTLGLVYACAIRRVLQKPKSVDAPMLCEALQQDKGVIDANLAKTILRDIAEVKRTATMTGKSGGNSALLDELTTLLQDSPAVVMDKLCVPKDAKQHIVLCLAVEYCLGRMTYMPGVVQGYIVKNAQYITKTAKMRMLRSIQAFEAAGCSLGMHVDAVSWKNFELWLIAQTN